MNDNVKRLVEQGEEITAQRDKGLMARVRYEDFAKDNLPALISALRELDEENARLNELCDAQKNRLEELWEEKARLRAELAAATEDIESIVSGGDPCDFCRNPNGCLWPASCPQKRYKQFTWRGKERSEHNA